MLNLCVGFRALEGCADVRQDQLIDGRDTNSYADQGRDGSCWSVRTKALIFTMQQQPPHMGRIPIPTLIKAVKEAAGLYAQ